MTVAAACRTGRAAGLPGQRGLSLVELLISMLLGLFLTSGMVSAYLESSRNFIFEEQAARMQENGRYASTLLKRELAMAGFFGGSLAMDTVAAQAVGTDCGDAGWALDGSSPLDLVDNHQGQSTPVTRNAVTLVCLDGASIEPLTDVVAVKRTAGEASMRDGTTAPGFTASTGEQWYLRQTNYRHSRWQKLRPVDLYDAAGPAAPVTFWEASAKIFYIRRYSDSGVTPDGVPTLCAESLVGNHMSTRCLVEGVENLQVEFGIDTDGDGVANRYDAAPDAVALAGAVSVKIYLLLRSLHEIAGYRNDKTYTLGRHRIAPGQDGFMRRVFTTTVQLRNRIVSIG